MADEAIYDPSIYSRRYTPSEEESLLPGLTTAYKAAGGVEKDATRLVIIFGKDGFRIGDTAYVALQYVHMGIGSFGFTANGQIFHFVFSDFQPKQLTVEGRNLQRIFDQIASRRMPWIRQIDRDFRAVDDTGSEPVITRIKVVNWEPLEPGERLP